MIAATTSSDYKELAANTEKVFYENYPEDSIELSRARAQAWWQFWPRPLT